MADATQQSAEDFLGPDPNSSAEAFLDAREPDDANADEVASETGAAEAALHYLSGGSVAPIAAGLTYLGTGGNKEAAERASQAFTYEPRGEQGQGAVRAVNQGAGVAANAARTVGEALTPADLRPALARLDPHGLGAATAQDVLERANIVAGALPVVGGAIGKVAEFRAPKLPEVPPEAPIPEPAATPPSIDEVLGPKNAAPQPQEAPAPETAKAQSKAVPEPAASPAAPKAAEAAEAAEAAPEAKELENQRALAAVGFDGPVRESALTGDKMTAATDAQVAKADTPKGREAQAIFDNEADTLQRYSDRLVDQAGGTRDITDSVANDTRGQTLAAPAQAGYDDLNARMKQLYQDADKRSATLGPTPLTQLSDLLQNKRSMFTVRGNDGVAILKGVQQWVKENGLEGPNHTILPMTPYQAEELRKVIGDGYSPRTGKLTGMLQDAIDDDVGKHAGEDLYGTSRALRRERDLDYDKPDAVSNLLEPKPGDKRGWAFGDIGKKLTRLPTEELAKYTKILNKQRANPALKPGAEAALHELRGQFAQMVQEAGKPSAAGVGKQAVWGADTVSKVLRENRARMQQVFTPAEMAQFDALDKAGKILKVDRTFKGSVVEGHNIAMRGALFAAEHVPTLAGAVLGHGMGAVAGEMIGKRLTSKLEAAAAPSVKTREPLGAQIAGGKMRGAVGDLSAARQTPADRMISNFENVTKEHPTQVGTRAFNGASVELSHDPFDPNTVHIESMRADKGGQGTSSKVLQGLTAMADRHGARLTLDSVPMKPNPGEAAIPADKLASIYKAHGFTPTEGGLVEGSAMERAPKGGATYPLAPAGERYSEIGSQPIKQMSPDEFLSKSRPLELDEASRDNIEDLKRHIQSGGELDPLHLLPNGKEDGRHRAYAAKELGISKVPVVDYRAPAALARPTFGPAPGEKPLGARIGGGMSQRGAVGNLSKKGATPEAVHAVSKTVDPADKPAAEAASTAVDDAQGKAAADIVRSNQLRASRTDAIQQLKTQAQQNVDPKKSMGPSVETGNPGKSPTMQLADAFDRALANHNSLPLKEKVANSKAARASVRQFVKGDLITQNGKLMKSNGENIETWGLALSPDYVEGRFMACPNSGACRDLCLGYTSGQFHAGGGGMDLSAFKGPRKAALDRTFAMLHDPQAFAVRLNDEITAAKHKAAANGNQLGIRLNVLSDLNPRIHQELIKAHPDVQFYDYTKMSYKPVAENHHYTHSSTGVSQPAGMNDNDTNVFNPHQNWTGKSGARAKLDGGDNVAMAFTHNRHLPTEVHDEETGKTYKVVNGDEHDFRPLDKQPAGQPGVIIGLKNKKVAGAKQEAHIDANGFFVHYDPKELRTPKGTLQRDANGDTTPTNRSVTIATQHGGTKLMTDNDLKQLAEKGLEAPWQRTK